MTTRTEKEERDFRAAAKAEIDAEFERQLASIRTPDARKRFDAAMAANGQVKRHSRAGDSF